MAVFEEVLKKADQKLFDVEALQRRTAAIIAAAGARGDIALTVAEVLIEGELLGRDTHGLVLAAPYARELHARQMNGDGEWRVERSSLAAELWDGCRLPGPWLVKHAIRVATQKARSCGIGTVSVGGSHHIACLAAYLRQPALDGLLTIIQSSDPAAAGVAPFGGTRAVISPNPLAAGIPALPQPIIIDVSTSITTFGAARRQASAGQRLPGLWLLDGAGRPTDDPAVLAATPPGTLLPLGGLDSGHKGFGLGILVDALTGALSGSGRVHRPTQWGASFLVTVIDPEAYCGLDRFIEETSHLVAITKDNPPIAGRPPVRMPGQQGLERRDDALRHGVALSPTTATALDDIERELGLA